MKRVLAGFDARDFVVLLAPLVTPLICRWKSSYHYSYWSLSKNAENH